MRLRRSHVSNYKSKLQELKEMSNKSKAGRISELIMSSKFVYEKSLLNKALKNDQGKQPERVSISDMTNSLVNRMDRYSSTWQAERLNK